MKNRKQEIIELRKNGKKLGVIGKKYNITPERVRQILESDSRKLCKNHNIMYLGVCKYCVVETEWNGKINSYSKKQIDQEIKKLSKKGRDSVSSLKRKILIKKIKNEWNISFSEIGKMLNRERTTISNYYYSK